MHRKTSIGQDKVYGPLSIVNNIDLASYPIDYAAPLAAVFAYATKSIIASHSDLQILALKRINPGRISQVGPSILPSWVPDFRFDDTEKENPRIHYGPRRMLRAHDRLFSASGMSKSHIQIDSDFSLRLQGVKVGTIDSLSECEQNNEKEQPIDPAVLAGGEWAHFCTRIVGKDGIYRPTGELPYRAYQRIRVWDYLSGERNPNDRKQRLAKPSKDISEPKTNAWIIIAAGSRHVAAESNDKTPNFIMNGTTQQRLFATSNTYLGICHRSCLEGDEIWVMMGSSLPYVLRKLEGGVYMFKGEAYVHGIVDGEFLVKSFKSRTTHSVGMTDTEWLHSLADDMPFPTEEVVIF